MAGQAYGGAARVLGLAALVGVVVGAGSIALTPDDRTSPEGRTSMATTTDDVAVAAGLARRRAPASGDHWGGCNDARAAGTAPIYRGEPGYRTDMDGDGDGIACEPIRG